MRIKNLLKDNSLLIAITITIIITLLSLIKSAGPTIQISNIDKVKHFIAYFVLTLCWLFAIKRTRLNSNVKYFVVFGCVFFGIIIEVLQATITNYREASYLDMLANFTGAFIALLFFNRKMKKN